MQSKFKDAACSRDVFVQETRMPSSVLPPALPPPPFPPKQGLDQMARSGSTPAKECMPCMNMYALRPAPVLHYLDDLPTFDSNVCERKDQE
eukprot:1160548-Pelagomonas_calceolata.AAC.6